MPTIFMVYFLILGIDHVLWGQDGAHVRAFKMSGVQFYHSMQPGRARPLNDTISVPLTGLHAGLATPLATAVARRGESWNTSN